MNTPSAPRPARSTERPNPWANRLAAIDGEELAQIYEQLRAHAQRLLADERRGHTLQATALVNEAMCKLLSERGGMTSARDQSGADAGTASTERPHARARQGAVDAKSAPSPSSAPSFRDLFGAISLRMRQVLVEHARRRNAQKGPGRWTHSRLSDAAEKIERDGIDLPELDRVLERFERDDPEAAAAFQLRWFAGMSIEQLAVALGVTEQVAQTRWTRARRRMMALLGRPEEPS